MWDTAFGLCYTKFYVDCEVINKNTAIHVLINYFYNFNIITTHNVKMCVNLFRKSIQNK